MKTSHRSSDAALRRQITRKVTRLLDTHNDRNWWLYPARERQAFSKWIFSQIKEAEARGYETARRLSKGPLCEVCDGPLWNSPDGKVHCPACEKIPRSVLMGTRLPVSVGSSEDRCPQCGGELEGRRCPKCQVTWYTESQKLGWLKKSLENERERQNDG